MPRARATKPLKPAKPTRSTKPPGRANRPAATAAKPPARSPRAEKRAKSLPAAASAKVGEAPSTTPREALAALDALGTFGKPLGAEYRQASGHALATLAAHGPTLADAVLERVRSAPFTVASVAATALLRMTRSDGDVMRLAHVLAAFDLPDRSEAWNQEWSLDVRALTKLLGARAREVFEAVLLRDGAPPPMRSAWYARQVLDKKSAGALIGAALERSSDPSWGVLPAFEDMAVPPAARERAILAYFARPAPTSDGGQRIWDFRREVGYALGLAKCPGRVIDRLREQALALAQMMQRAYYSAFDDVMATPELRAARKHLSKAVAPIVSAYDQIKPLSDAALKLRDRPPARLSPATLDRFRDAIASGTLRWHLASAATAAAQQHKPEVARALAELVLAHDPKDTRAAWALELLTPPVPTA